MTRYEVTNERPTDYSTWHRKELPDNCPTLDIDWLEVRYYNQPKAIIETGRMGISKFSKWQREIVLTVAKKLKIKAYFVEYSIDEYSYDKNIFNVENLVTGKKYLNVSNTVYKEFLKNIDEHILKLNDNHPFFDKKQTRLIKVDN